jgi:hypothetical protein
MFLIQRFDSCSSTQFPTFPTFIVKNAKPIANITVVNLDALHSKKAHIKSLKFKTSSIGNLKLLMLEI